MCSLIDCVDAVFIMIVRIIEVLAFVGSCVCTLAIIAGSNTSWSHILVCICLYVYTCMCHVFIQTYGVYACTHTCDHVECASKCMVNAYVQAALATAILTERLGLNAEESRCHLFSFSLSVTDTPRILSFFSRVDVDFFVSWGARVCAKSGYGQNGPHEQKGLWGAGDLQARQVGRRDRSVRDWSLCAVQDLRQTNERACTERARASERKR